MIGQFAILILSIDAPLRMLLDNDQTKEFIRRNFVSRTNMVRLATESGW